MPTFNHSQTSRWSWGCAAALAICASSFWPASPAHAQGSPVIFTATIHTPPTVHAPRLNEVRRALVLAQLNRAAEREQPVALPKGIALEWVEVPGAMSDVIRSTGSLTLRALNLDQAAYVMQTTVIGDAGSLHSRTRAEAVAITLPGDALQEIRIDAATLGEWAFSGAVTVHIKACPVGGAGNATCLVAISEPVFFHPVGTGPAMRFYGAGALAARYRSGDLRGSMPPSNDGAATQRAMGGGPLRIDPATDAGVKEER